MGKKVGDAGDGEESASPVPESSSENQVEEELEEGQVEEEEDAPEESAAEAKKRSDALIDELYSVLLESSLVSVHVINNRFLISKQEILEQNELFQPIDVAEVITEDKRSRRERDSRKRSRSRSGSRKHKHKKSKKV